MDRWRGGAPVAEGSDGVESAIKSGEGGGIREKFWEKGPEPMSSWAVTSISIHHFHPVRLIHEL